jgi:hypothetical protein
VGIVQDVGRRAPYKAEVRGGEKLQHKIEHGGGHSARQKQDNTAQDIGRRTQPKTEAGGHSARYR